MKRLSILLVVAALAIPAVVTPSETQEDRERLIEMAIMAEEDAAYRAKESRWLAPIPAPHIVENVNRLKTTGHCPGCDLHEANLANAELREADLRGANLTEANLYHAKLTGADLTGADLRGANLYDAFLTKVKLSRADLRKADLRYISFLGIDLTEANLTGALILESALAELNLTGRTDLDVRQDQATLMREAKYCDVDADCVIKFDHELHICLGKPCSGIAINRYFDPTMLIDDVETQCYSDPNRRREIYECAHQEDKPEGPRISCLAHMCVVNR